MFPNSNSDIAKRFQCGCTKAGYVAHFGLVPYFLELMLSKLLDCPYFSLSFDESSNSSVQKGQMDIIIWFWGSETNCVATHYLRSEFVGRSTAEDVLQTFLAGISDLDQSKILQFASDGPNVNLLFLKNLAESQEEKELLPLLDIGKCRLHVIHDSFKTGGKKGSYWELQKLLKAMWKFLQEAPTRRSLYENVSDSLDYPLQFYGHHWCKIEKSVERVEIILEGYRRFIIHTCGLKKSQQPDGKNKSFQYLKSMIHDPLLPAKLKFFEMVFSKLNAFFKRLANQQINVSFYCLHSWRFGL